MPLRRTKNKELIKLLLENGCDPNLDSKNETTFENFLWYFYKFDFDKTMLESFISAGAELITKDDSITPCRRIINLFYNGKINTETLCDIFKKSEKNPLLKHFYNSIHLVFIPMRLTVELEKFLPKRN